MNKKLPRSIVATDITFWEPGVGSHSRIAQICNLLSKNFELTVFVFKTITKKAQTLINAKKYPFKIVSYKPYEARTASEESPLNQRHEVIQLSKWYFLSWERAFRLFVAEYQPQVICVEYIRLEYLIRNIESNILTILDSHDIMSDRSVSFAAFGKVPGISMSLAEEVRLMSRFDMVLAISQPDYIWLKRYLEAPKCAFIPFIPDVTIQPTGRGPTSRLVYAGADSPANKMSLEWFLDYVWPYVDDKIKLDIYGSVGFGVNPRRNVFLHGVVDNVSDIYQNYGVSINPVFFGGGLKIKTLEALMMGLPVIASSEGARGLKQFENSGLFVVHSRADLIETIEMVASIDASSSEWLLKRASCIENYAQLAEASHFISVVLNRVSAR